MKVKTSAVLDEIVSNLQCHELTEEVLKTFNRASDIGDFYHIKTREFIASGGVEIRMAVRAAAKVIKPKLYFEIGVRYGWSAAQAAVEMGDNGYVTLVDMWQTNYAGLETKGPEYALAQIEQMVGHDVMASCFNGDSHLILPRICKSMKIDLATVDGDHRATGAWADLCDVMPYVNVGGAVIFDDLFQTAHEHQLGLPPMDVGDRLPYPIPGIYSLRALWEALPMQFPNWVYWDNAGDPLDQSDHPNGTAPVGIAVRVK